MSDATNLLQQRLAEYRFSSVTLRSARAERDEARREAKDLEYEIFASKTQIGVIDGKNAETRDAQAQLAFKADTRWQSASDRYRDAESEFLIAQDEVALALTSLRVQATIVNAEIAETGATRLLAEISLAGV